VRFSGQLPTDRADSPELTSAAGIAEAARALERAGFDAGYVTEHPFPPRAWLRSGGHHALDPFVALAVAASATTRLRLHTNVLVLPYRNPFLTAKAVASLDVVSGGRVILGVAAGYLEAEYAALGARFDARNASADDGLAAMKAAWTGAEVVRTGPGYQADGNIMLPTTVQQPHPPIWVGGNSARAIRRAAEHAQGWSPFPVPRAYAGRTRTRGIESISDLAAGIARLREEAASRGRRETLEVNFVPFGMGMNADRLPDADAFCEQAQKLEAIGVSWLSVGMPGRSAGEVVENAVQFGERMIARLRRR
jgi:probable F420-dependent oxidoreductase